MDFNPEDDKITHQIWVSHRDNYQDVTKPYNARNDLMKEMKRLITKMGLSFVKIQQSIKVIHNNSNDQSSPDEGRSALSSGKTSSNRSGLSVGDF
jgi:uncharacterized protein (UPF0147 family)